MPQRPATTAGIAAFRAIKEIADLAAFLGTTEKRLFYHLYSPSRPRYRLFRIPKASGGYRDISAPPSTIGAWQRSLLPVLEALLSPNPYVHGFVTNRSIRSNGQRHVRSGAVLNFDLQNFFPSIHFGRVRGLFHAHPFDFSASVAAVLAQICCFNRSLPQGAPTSPIISNYICRGLDKDLATFARTHRCRYSRYCDDITFSTTRDNFSPTVVEFAGGTFAPTIGAAIVAIVTTHSFAINAHKTRVQTSRQRQMVTGLVVNERVNVPRRFVRNIRAILHASETHGVSAADADFRTRRDRHFRQHDSPSLAVHTFGKLAFLRMIKGSDDATYLRLALRARRCFTDGTAPPICISGSVATVAIILKEAMWIIVGRDVRGDAIVEASAFMLEGVGIATALHVFTSQVCVSYELRPASDASKSYKIDAIRAAYQHDVAIVESCAPAFGALRRAEADAMPVLGSRVTLAGYPVWLSPKDDLLVCHTEVIQTKTAGETTYMLVGAQIRGGNSGGPLLSKEGYAAGIAVYDSESAIAPNGCVAIGHISAALSEAPTSPTGF